VERAHDVVAVDPVDKHHALQPVRHGQTKVSLVVSRICRIGSRAAA
jgi:hypothetical protein